MDLCHHLLEAKIGQKCQISLGGMFWCIVTCGLGPLFIFENIEMVSLKLDPGSGPGEGLSTSGPMSQPCIGSGGGGGGSYVRIMFDDIRLR